jgi:hypothetical protein
MNEIRKQIRTIRSRELKLKQDTEKLLRDLGWAYSSDYPDCCWRWSKVLCNKVVTTASADEALSLEAACN